jgi:Zn finger protein HypA/HybF involved in hydrogenase expression
MALQIAVLLCNNCGAQTDFYDDNTIEQECPECETIGAAVIHE